MKYNFGDCELDTGGHVLRRSGGAAHVEPQVFDLLVVLAAAAGELVSYDDLITQVWKGRIVSDATMAARISAARTAVGDSGKTQRVIRTVVRRGVQMAVPVREMQDASRVHQTPSQQVIRFTKSQDGSGIAWSSLGDGPPLLRAGHWMTHLERDMDSQVWRPWIDGLGRGRRIIRYDPRGTGMSDQPQGPRSLKANVADMAAVADAAKLDRFALYATSQSAAVACIYVAENPDRVSRLIIHGGFAQGSIVRDGADGAAMTGALSSMIRKGWGQPESGFMRSLSSLFIPGASEDQMRDFVGMQIVSSDPESAVEIRECCARYDIVDLLPRVKSPTLVAHSVGDSLQPYAQAQIFAREIPDARLMQLDSPNHVLLPDEPAFGILMQAIDRFLAETD